MERWQNRVAVVTGASSGIGEAIAKDLIAAGLKVVALGRRLDRMYENRSKIPMDDRIRYFARKCDVTDEADVIASFKWIEKNVGGVDILVNNAGMMRFGNMLEMDIADIDAVLNTNVRGLIYCSREAFKSMKARNIDGHIVHINSIAGHGAVSGGDTSFNIYPPSKCAVTAINETLRNELRILETKVKTTSISPGAVRTEIVPQEFFNRFPSVLNPEDISQAVLFAISTPPHVQIHEMTVLPLAVAV